MSMEPGSPDDDILRPDAVGGRSFPPEGPNSLASIGQRAAARFIDALILLIPVLALVVPNIDFEGDEVITDVPLGATLATFAIVAAYEVVLIALRGQTLGKMAMGIRVATYATGEVPSWTAALIRYLLPTVVGVIPGIGGLLTLVVYLSAVWDQERRGWHDKAAGTVVVRAR